MSSDDQLILEFQKGSREAFRELFERYRDPIYGFFRRRLDNPARAEELAQECFLAILRNAARYEPRAGFRTYLYGIAVKMVSAEQQAGQIEAPESRGPMIVETASITILATNYDQASGAIQRVTAQHGGYIQDMTADTRTGIARSVSATLRVPEKQLEAFLVDLRELGHVEQETRNNQEITGQYMDLTARLKTARATERRITELLESRTGKLSDVLDAERELARIRGEIEITEGQRANMQHQVSYATVQVQLNEEYREQLSARTYSTGTRVRNSLVNGFRNLAGGVVALVIFLFAYGPSILFWSALFGVPGWFVWRHYRRPRTA